MPRSPSSIFVQKKIRILFYHAGEHTSWVYPAALHLKTYVDLFYPDAADQIEWLIPLQQQVTDEELVRRIKNTNANVLCTSHYLWNHAFLTNQLANIKSQLKSNFKVIAGGPSIDVNNNENFFDQYPRIDYAVYGAGEQAFADIVNHLVTEKPLIAFNTSNCAWKNQFTGQPIVADYKFVKMLDTSPFVHNEAMFEAMVADAKQKNKSVWLPYTLTRGCPYSCTFCDWNSGLGNKVSRRKNTYQQEIDLFQRLGVINIYLADANVGQYDEDVEMVEYFAQKNLKENAGFHVSGNYSKLKKENNLKIFHALARGQLINKTFNFSIQDINQEILKNTDRPDVGWDVHVAMANELRQNYPDLLVKVQLIYGLPGQTTASWRQTLDEIAQQNMLPVIFLNEPLPASPAMYDPEYQRQFQFEYTHSNRILRNYGKDDCYIYSSLIPKTSSTFDQADIVQMNLLNAFYFAIVTINIVLIKNHVPPLDITATIETLLQTPNYQTLYNNLYHNWTVENNFYYTMNFDEAPSKIFDTRLGHDLITSDSFMKLVMTLLLPEYQYKFSWLCGASMFKKLLLATDPDVD